MNIVIKPDARQEGNRWIPDGMVRFPNGPELTERREFFDDPKFNTKKEADQYFMQACKKKYRIND